MSYFEFLSDDGVWLKTRNSGMLVYTGTGSTSWYIFTFKITDLYPLSSLPPFQGIQYQQAINNCSQKITTNRCTIGVYAPYNTFYCIITYLPQVSLFLSAIAQSSGAVNVEEDPDRTTEKSERNLLYIIHDLPCCP